MGKDDDRRSLTDLQERFCQLFVFGNFRRPGPNDLEELTEEERADLPPDTRGNRTQSYIQAGYKSRGSNARAEAHRMLGKPHIRYRIQELREEHAQMQEAYWNRLAEIMPQAQRALLEALGSPGERVQAAKYLWDRYEGPPAHRFRVKDRQGKVKEASAMPVLVLGFDDEEELPASFEPRPEEEDEP